MITIYVYHADSKKYSHRLVTTPETAMLNITSDLDYTLAPPPDYEHQWRWVDSEWTIEPAN